MGAIRYWLWLSAQSGVSAQAKAALIDHYKDAENAFFAPDGEYEKIPGISRAEAQRLEKRQMERYGKSKEYNEYANKTPIIIPLLPIYHLNKQQ